MLEARRKLKKKIEFRVQLTVEEGSAEERLWSYLHDKKQRPFTFKQMVMTALKSYWLPMAWLSQNREQAQSAMLDSLYNFQLHSSYLKQQFRENLDRETIESVTKVEEDYVDVFHI